MYYLLVWKILISNGCPYILLVYEFVGTYSTFYVCIITQIASPLQYYLIRGCTFLWFMAFYLIVNIVGFTITLQDLFGSSEKKFSCKGCSKKYRTKHTLMAHVRHVCGKEPRFKCVCCPYKAHQKSQVQDHMASKHGILVDKTLPLT